ncbi:hypothetical protein BC835DRAFT_1089962 [Cytidiella melzeri]|nr:hypothetical protein BC835DRAFT_1089962 [Cytidiella melzeri]
MPLELPGFYWDESRQRYFPITTRSRQPHGWQPSPTVASSTTSQPSSSSATHDAGHAQTTAVRPAKKKRFDTFLPTYAARERTKHVAMTNSISALSQGSIVYTGDFPYTSIMIHPSSPDIGGSVILSTGDTVSFGPSSKIAMESTAQDSEMWTIVSMPDQECHDVRVAHLSGSSLALGAANRGILFPNLEYSWHYDILPTGSDVLAIAQRDHLVYTGTRNGSVNAFDMRISTHSQRKSQPLLRGDRPKTTDTPCSITHLGVVNEWQMVISTIRGDGIATSPCASYLFAAGQDNRIRAWSLRTGNSITPHSHRNGSTRVQFRDDALGCRGAQFVEVWRGVWGLSVRRERSSLARILEMRC